MTVSDEKPFDKKLDQYVRRLRNPTSGAMLVANRGEAERAMIAREAFIARLAEDPRVHALFAEWLKRSCPATIGLVQEVCSNHRLERLALWHEVRANSHRNWDVSLRSLERFNVESKRLNDGKKLIREARRFVVHTLGLSWAWLPGDIMSLFDSIIFAPDGSILALCPPTFNVSTLAPRAKLSFKTEHGETLADALSRLDRAYAETMEQLLAAETNAPKGRAPKSGGDHIRQWARWLYQHDVMGESQAHVARTLHSERHITRFDRDCGCRQQVADGIRAARELLDFSPFELVKSKLPTSPTSSKLRAKRPPGKK